MPSRKNVQSTHIKKTPIGDELRQLHGALLDVMAAMNRPQGDEMLIQAAGIPLDRALFPLLVSIGRWGPIGVVDLAERAGRDYTTVSRQVAKLEQLGLAERRLNAEDARMRAIILSAKGKAMTDRVDQARERIGRAVFAQWAPGDVSALARLMRQFADALVSLQAGDK